MNHAVGTGHIHLDVFNDREGDHDAKFFLDALCPRQVGIQAVNRQAEQFAIHFRELGRRLGKADELGRAHGREIRWMRKKNKPLAFVICQCAVTKCGLDIEVRGLLVEAGETEGLNVFHN